MAESNSVPTPNHDGLQRIARILSAATPAASAEVLARLCDEHRDLITASMKQCDTGNGVAEVQLSLDFLSEISQPVLFRAILRERPQTLALLLSILPSELAPKVIRALNADRQTAVINCLSRQSQVSVDVIAAVLEAFQDRVNKIEAQAARKNDGVGRVVQILQACDRTTEWSIVRALAEDHPELTEEIQQMLFSFEDIATLSDHDFQELARNVPSETWAIAMKRSSAEVSKRLFNSLSPRSAQQVRAEMNYHGQSLPSEIDRCQQQIIDTARRLDQAGRIKRAA